MSLEIRVEHLMDFHFINGTIYQLNATKTKDTSLENQNNSIISIQSLLNSIHLQIEHFNMRE